MGCVLLVVRVAARGTQVRTKLITSETKETTMDLNKAKDMAGEHRDKIQDGAEKAIDSKLDGDKADKAKDGLNKGMDKVLGDN